MTDKRKTSPKSKPKLPRGKPGAVADPAADPATTKQPSTAKFAAKDMGVAAKE